MLDIFLWYLSWNTCNISNISTKGRSQQKKKGLFGNFSQVFPSVPNVPADMFRLGSPGFEGLGVEVWPRGLCVLWVVLYCVWCTVLESLCGGVGYGGLCVMVWWVVWLNQSTYCVVWWVVWCQKAGDRLISCAASGKTTPLTALTMMITVTMIITLLAKIITWWPLTSP